VNPVARRILAELRRHGPLPFARFMELALYCPLCGYYEQEADRIGRRGDYYTSPRVGPLFGELLAVQFAAWLTGLPARPAPAAGRGAAARLQLVEAGAHDGQLAADVLAFLRRHHPDLFAVLAYWIVEPSARWQARQRQTLAPFGERVRWAQSWTHLAEDCPGGICGVIFANELLDAMPVRRLGWDAAARQWFEWGVGLREGRDFEWVRLPPAAAPPAALAALLRQAGLEISPALAAVLPDGFTTEVCPAATDWWRAAAAALRAGKLVAIDYGLSAEEFLAPHRTSGTLRAYWRHQVTADVLADPGQQDLTAHVNFTALRTAGEAAGLRTEALETQARFLTRIAAHTWRNPAAFGQWTPARRRQFQTLTHPEHLGRSFRVLIQAR